MYDREQEQGFGRRADWACPFWVKGPLSCSIWEDRNHTCRSWHCKHVDKAAGQRLWAAQRALGRAVESALAVEFDAELEKEIRAALGSVR